MNMAEATLTICSLSQVWRVNLNPQSTVIGRDPNCDVVIDNKEVSRRHAEVFQTPGNDWVIKDLGSSNGTFVNGKRIESCAITADDVVQIGPVCLLLGERLRPRVIAPVSSQQPKITVEDFGTEIFYDRPRIEECTTQPCPQKLEKARERLSRLTEPGGVYVEVCRVLAQDPSTAAAVFRVSPQESPMSRTPELMAYHFGSSGEDTRIQPGNKTDPFHRGLRVSRRLLEAVHASARPLMTKSIFSCDTQVTISLIDEHSPRALLCAPIGRKKDAMDLLYVDVPIEDHMAHGPEEMFAFVQAVAQHATFVTTASASANDKS